MFLLINGSELKQNYRDARKTTVTNVLLIDVWKFKQNDSYANTVWIVFCLIHISKFKQNYRYARKQS